MKRRFTPNGHIHRTRLPTKSNTELQHNVSEAMSKSGSPRNRDFQNLLMEAIDEGLSLLGSSSKQAIYFYLEKTFAIKKHDIPSKIGEFTNAIEEIFGRGAKILEIQIMKHLYEKVGHDFEYFPEDDELVFTEYVEAARMHVAKSPLIICTKHVCT